MSADGFSSSTANNLDAMSEVATARSCEWVVRAISEIHWRRLRSSPDLNAIPRSAVRIMAPLELPMKCTSDSLTGSPTAARVVGPSPRKTGRFSFNSSINRCRAEAGLFDANDWIERSVSRVSSLTPPSGQSAISDKQLSTV